MEYMSTSDAAKKWGVHIRVVQEYCKDNRVPGARKYGVSWMLPSNAKKPKDARAKKGSLGRRRKRLNVNVTYLPDLYIISTIPYRPGHINQLLAQAADDEELRQIKCEIAYMRGDFQEAKECYLKTTSLDKTRLCALMLAFAVASNTNDYPLFCAVRCEMEKLKRQYANISPTNELIWLALQIEDTSLYLQREPFDPYKMSSLPMEVRCYAMIYYMRYLHMTRDFVKLTGIGEAALILSARQKGVLITDIYLHIMCAIGYFEQHLEQDMMQHIDAALDIAMKDGLITPICENFASIPGAMQQRIKQKYPDKYELIMDQSETSIKNWINIHNQFTRDNVTTLLTIQEMEIATLATRGKTNAEIARITENSVSDVKKTLESVYAKLFITKRSDLKQYIIWSERIR